MANELASYYTQDYYDKQRAYTEHLRYPINRLLAERLATGKKDKVLDVGCAKGYLIKAFLELGCDAYGFDISKYATDNGAVKDRMTVCDAENDRFPYRDKAFDLVTAFECMEHLRQPEHAINEMCRVLKKGGYVAIASPMITWQRRVFQFFYPNPILHPSELPFMKWLDLFAACGFGYWGDFTANGSVEWKSRYDKALYNMTKPMPPQTLYGKILHKLRLDWLRARINIWLWQPEFMLFKKL